MMPRWTRAMARSVANERAGRTAQDPQHLDLELPVDGERRPPEPPVKPIE